MLSRVKAVVGAVSVAIMALVTVLVMILTGHADAPSIVTIIGMSATCVSSLLGLQVVTDVKATVGTVKERVNGGLQAEFVKLHDAITSAPPAEPEPPPQPPAPSEMGS